MRDEHPQMELLLTIARKKLVKALRHCLPVRHHVFAVSVTPLIDAAI
jgi:hypothetical protein